MKSKSSTIRLLYAASDSSADALYLSGVFVPDPFLAIITEKKSYAVVSQLEFARVARQSRFDEVMLLEAMRQKAAENLQMKCADVGPGELMIYFAQRFAVKKIEVPADFPAVFYAKLYEAGYRIQVVEGAFFPQRAKKDDSEARAIRQGNAASAAGIRAAEAVLRAARIEGNRILYQGRALTSERLRTLIDQACLEKGATASRSIVAGGRQACDPHEVGHGLLRPNQLIIIDVFPRVQKTGYHGDMTRTFLKGRASSAQRALVAAVQQAHRAALAQVKAGVKGATVHAAAEAVFQAGGYVTERRAAGFVGFIHSTGHGLGLDVHEAPRVSKGAGKLKAGNVITIEPGLYYPEIGGCRIEDVVRVSKEGYQKLSKMHYRWEIR
ncbi:MAG: aminopeptidase P family protein [Puniceicoccaceae bacterium]|nr:MAG: aminopeptidase P family protein [Puniceicoccaceae bacterium]